MPFLVLSVGGISLASRLAEIVAPDDKRHAVEACHNAESDVLVPHLHFDEATRAFERQVGL